MKKKSPEKYNTRDFVCLLIAALRTNGFVTLRNNGTLFHAGTDAVREEIKKSPYQEFCDFRHILLDQIAETGIQYGLLRPHPDGYLKIDFENSASAQSYMTDLLKSPEDVQKYQALARTFVEAFEKEYIEVKVRYRGL